LGTTVFIDANNKLGTMTSSKRYKEDIKPIGNASEALFELEPVTFHYKKQIDPEGRSQFGLVAEDVKKVKRDLVVRDKEGKPYSVRYDQVNAMLLNEFLKEHRAFVEEQHKVAEEQKEIEALKSELKQQRSLIQKVSDKVELTQSATMIATRNP
jgi:trimeric autotransporter adhesin